MDKRRAWREQEQKLIERWNTMCAREQTLQAEITRQTGATGAADAAVLAQAAQSRSEMEAVRREVARMKVQFNTGKRY